MEVNTNRTFDIEIRKDLNMEKAFLVYGSWGMCDDSGIVGLFTDESKADNYIEEHMVERNKDIKQHEKCQRCRRVEKDYEDDEEYFDLENECEEAKIGIDRNGKYCEHDMSEYYSITSNSYWKEEVEILG